MAGKDNSISQIYGEAIEVAQKRFNVTFKESSSIQEIIEKVEKLTGDGINDADGVRLFHSIMKISEDCFYSNSPVKDLRVTEARQELEKLEQLWATQPVMTESRYTEATAPDQITEELVQQRLEMKNENIEARQKNSAPIFSRPSIFYFAQLFRKNIWAQSTLLLGAILVISTVYVAYSFYFISEFASASKAISYFPWSWGVLFSNYGVAISQFYAGIVVFDIFFAVSSAALVFYFVPNLRKSLGVLVLSQSA